MNDELSMLIQNNSDLIYKIANKYVSSYYSINDLYQVGIIGLIKAYKRYDKNKGAKFSTYAYNDIHGEIVKFISSDRMIKTNSESFKLFSLYEKTKSKLEQHYKRKVSFTEVCSFININESEVYNALIDCSYVLSSDAKLNDEGFNLNNIYYEDKGDLRDKLVDLRNEISKLSSEERKIIELRYFNDLTQSETANEVGLSQVQVSRSETKILSKLRRLCA